MSMVESSFMLSKVCTAAIVIGRRIVFVGYWTGNISWYDVRDVCILNLNLSMYHTVPERSSEAPLDANPSL